MILAAYFNALDPIAVQLGPLAIRWYGLAYVLGFIGGYFLLVRLAKRGLIDLPPHRVADALLLLDIGAMVSFTGVVTYKNAQGVREALALAPLERIMIETDAPFLPPEPVRGQRPCTPAMSRITAEFVAREKGVSWDAFHAQINANCSRFFGIT